MFKKGDYIVVKKTSIITTSCAKNNYCFKQRNESNYLQPEMDLGGFRDNGNTYLIFRGSSDFTWRYATPQEIQEYDRMGEPYDTTTLISKDINYEIY